MSRQIGRKEAGFVACVGAGMLACFSGVPPAPPLDGGVAVRPDAGPPRRVETPVDAGRAPVCDTYRPLARASGVLNTTVHPIDYSGGEVLASLVHKRDVDPVEDGCVGKAVLTIWRPGEQCELRLEYLAWDGSSHLELHDATLWIDSACPGWLDGEEGTFLGQSATGAWLSLTQQAPDDTASACFAVNLQLTGIVDLWAPGRPPLQIDLGGLVITGSAHSSGDVNMRCPAP